MPRTKTEPAKGIHIRLPADLVRKVKLLLLDPVTGRVRYGMMNATITELLTTWVERRQKEHKQSKEKPHA